MSLYGSDRQYLDTDHICIPTPWNYTGLKRRSSPRAKWTHHQPIQPLREQNSGKGQQRSTPLLEAVGRRPCLRGTRPRLGTSTRYVLVGTGSRLSRAGKRRALIAVVTSGREHWVPLPPQINLGSPKVPTKLTLVRVPGQTGLVAKRLTT